MRSLFSLRRFSTLPDHVKCEIPEVYPAVNIFTKDLIMYPAKYGTLANKCLQVKTPKKNIVFADALPDFLAKQKQEDQTHLAVPKEVIFIGRSNVGKSSLLNAVFNQKIGNVSKTPGTTKTLIYHEIYNGKAFMVDAPGYGFAQMNLSMRKKWLNLLRTYLSESTRISRVYTLINMEHGIKQTDFEFLEFVNKYKHCVQLVFTKCDKVRKDELLDRAVSIGHQVKQFNMVAPVAHLCSSKTKFGIDFLRYSVTSSVVDFYSKFELEHLKYKQRLAKLEGPKEEDLAKKLPPPDEMFKLLVRDGDKPF